MRRSAYAGILAAAAIAAAPVAFAGAPATLLRQSGGQVADDVRSRRALPASTPHRYRSRAERQRRRLRANRLTISRRVRRRHRRQCRAA